MRQGDSAPCCKTGHSGAAALSGAAAPDRHLAAAEGCFSVVEWLLKEANADANSIDRFNRTPLEARPERLCNAGAADSAGAVRLALPWA